MENEDQPTGLSPTVRNVIGRFIAALRADEQINKDAVGRLERLLREGAIPKPDEINAALFASPPDVQT